MKYSTFTQELIRAARSLRGRRRRGRGQKGGLSEYARQVGKGKATISEYKSAANVLLNCSLERTVLIDKAKHLAAIHLLPESTWQPAVNLMLRKEWSAKETQAKKRQGAKSSIMVTTVTTPQARQRQDHFRNGSGIKSNGRGV